MLLNLFADTSLVNRAMVDDLLKYKRLDGVHEALEQLAATLFVKGVQQRILAQQISALDLNTLVVWGAEDAVIPSAHAHNIETARVEIIDGAGHMVQMEQAGMVNTLLLGHILGG